MKTLNLSIPSCSGNKRISHGMCVYTIFVSVFVSECINKCIYVVRHMFSPWEWISRSENQPIKHPHICLFFQDPSVKTIDKDCKLNCETELNPDGLFQGERYEARTRVLVSQAKPTSTWSDWSPTTSWVSPVGKTKPPGKYEQRWLVWLSGWLFSLRNAYMQIPVENHIICY